MDIPSSGQSSPPRLQLRNVFGGQALSLKSVASAYQTVTLGEDEG
jgi:hypothetical protein